MYERREISGRRWATQLNEALQGRRGAAVGIRVERFVFPVVAEGTSNLRAVRAQPLSKRLRFRREARPSPRARAQAGVDVAQHAPAMLAIFAEVNRQKDDPDCFVYVSVPRVIH